MADIKGILGGSAEVIYGLRLHGRLFILCKSCRIHVTLKYRSGWKSGMSTDFRLD